MNRRDLLGILSRTPERRWPEGALHHGARFLLLLLLAFSVSALFPVSPLADAPPVERGGVLEEDVVAEVAFPVFKSDAELAQERAEAAAAVNPVFVYHTAAMDSMLTEVERFFGQVDSVVAAAGGGVEGRRRLQDLLGTYGLRVSTEEVNLLLDAQMRASLRATVRDVILDELPAGIARGEDLEEAGRGRIRILGMGEDRIVPTDSVFTVRYFYDRAKRHVPTLAPSSFEDIQHYLLARFVVPSLVPDRGATERLRAQARNAVDPVKVEVKQGQRIVPAREPVTEQHVEWWQAYQQELQRQGENGGSRGLRSVGTFLFNLITLSLFGVLLYFYRPDVYRNLRHVSVIAVLILALVVVAAIIAGYGLSVALVPIAFPALVLAILWDGRLALNLSLILAVLLAGQTAFVGLGPLLTLVFAGAVASLSVRVVRRRAEIWVFILMIAGAYVLIGAIVGLMRGLPIAEIGATAGWGTVNAIASAFAAMGFLPLLESVTKITTDQTLLELADANRPLLRRLSMEAPGTYAHSINVANLAEAAAGAIEANTLLTRVGVYYHDVGKIERPHYFIENQPGGRNPHDKLKPGTSAQVVRDHVVKGLELAEEAKLPDCVKAFILEHHGTQSISFFYEQAREADPDGTLDPKAFAYPGPRPQSRETAIVMLADSVESAARAMQDPTPAGIRELVDRIVQRKIDARQLDDTPLTVRELTRIKEQFVNVLTGMYHQRIDYPPTPEELAARDEAGGPGPAGGGPGGAPGGPPGEGSKPAGTGGEEVIVGSTDPRRGGRDGERFEGD